MLSTVERDLIYVFKSLPEPKQIKAKHKNIQHFLTVLYMKEILMHVLLHAVLDTGILWSGDGSYFSSYVSA